MSDEPIKQQSWVRDDILNDSVKDPIQKPEGIEEKQNE